MKTIAQRKVGIIIITAAVMCLPYLIGCDNGQKGPVGPAVFYPPAPDPPPPLVVEVGRDITPPRRIHFVRPTYTEAARHTRLEGAVILELIIDKSGRVESITVLRGLGLGLTESAIAAARQWRFEPSLYGGRPVSVIYRLTVNFAVH